MEKSLAVCVKYRVLRCRNMGQASVYIDTAAFCSCEFRAGKTIEKSSKPRFILAAGILYNLAWLGVFKYADFIIDNINLLSEKFGDGHVTNTGVLLLPIGISFYTFQAISYLVDVYRRDVAAERNFVSFGTYFTHVSEDHHGTDNTFRHNQKRSLKNRAASMENFDRGLRMFAMGLGL